MLVLKRILIALLTVVVIGVIVGFLLPRSRHVERSISIAAPPCVVFAKVNSLKAFNDWSPFVAVEPDLTFTFEGPDFGVGARMAWTSEPPADETGSQEIVASTPYQSVKIDLDLGDQGTAQTAYLLDREGDGTRLTWTFDTDYGLDLRGRYFGLFLDRMLGALYNQGLINLKRIAEDLPKVDWSDIEIGITDVSSTTIAYSTGSSGREPGEIADGLAAAFGRVAVFVSTNGLQIAGAPQAIANFWDERGYGFDAGIPVNGAPARGAGPESPVRMGETYGGRVVRAVHIGPYTGMEATYRKIDAFMVAHGLDKNGRSWESYVSDPGSTPVDELITEIYSPAK